MRSLALCANTPQGKRARCHMAAVNKLMQRKERDTQQKTKTSAGYNDIQANRRPVGPAERDRGASQSYVHADVP